MAVQESQALGDRMGANGSLPSTPPRRYTLYGLQVDSEFRLPVAPVLPSDEGAPDLVFRRHDHGSPPPPDGPMIAMLPCEIHGMDGCAHRGPGGTWIWHRAFGTCHVAADARRVDIYPEAGVDERARGLFLAGPLALFILHCSGCPSLHASAVLTRRGAVAFLGSQDRGKSTMAAAFLRRGAPFLTDDALPLHARDDGIYGAPGLPFMKVWHETAACALELTDELPDLMDNFAKKRLELDGRFQFAKAPARLRALYLLHRYDPEVEGRTEIVIQVLSRRESLAALLAQTSNRDCLLPAEEARFLPLYARLVAQAPVRVLSFPHGFEYQEAVYRRVMADLEGP